MNSLPANSTIHILAGLYQTKGQAGFKVKTCQKILGSGIDVTILQLPTGYVFGGSGATIICSQQDPGVTNCEVCDLTCDCNKLNNSDTYNGVYLDGSQNAIRRVKVINCGKFGGNSEAWGIDLSNTSLPNSVGNIIEDCEVSQFNGGTANLSAIGIGGCSATVRHNRVLMTPGQYCFGINEAAVYNTIIEGNYVENADCGSYTDTYGRTNELIINNTFKNCAFGIRLLNSPVPSAGGAFVNISIVNNNIQVQSQQNGEICAIQLGAVYNEITNIIISGNVAICNPPTGSFAVAGPFFIDMGALISGLTINNNSIDSQMQNDRLSPANAVPLNMFNNYDLFGNLSPTMNITTVGGVPVSPLGYSFLGAASPSVALTAIGLPSSAAAIVTNNETQPTTFGANLAVNGSISEAAGQAYLYNGVDMAYALTGLNDYFFAGAGNFTMSGFQNFAIGPQALASDTTGFANNAIGYQALQNNTSGIFNVANGSGALGANTVGSYNLAEGYCALCNNTNGNGNTAVGYNSLLSAVSVANTAVGLSTMRSDTTGGGNSAFGASALYGGTTGINNTAIGLNALFNNGAGNFNSALGYNAGYNITNGSYNIDIANSGQSTDNGIIRIGDTQQTDTYLAGVVHIASNLVVSGTCSAASYSGNGAGLTNLNLPAHPLLFAVLTTNLTISNNIEQRIWFNSNLSSNGIAYSTSSGVTITSTGIYQVNTTVAWQSVPSSTACILWLVKNGTDYLRVQNNPSQNNSLTLSTAIPLNAGDTVDFHVWQNAGSPINIGGNASPAYQSYLSFLQIQ